MGEGKGEISSEVLLQVVGLYGYYGYRCVLQNFNLKLTRKETVCILGPNGAGKSTLLSRLVSRAAPEKGEIIYRGQLIDSFQERRFYLSKIGYLGHDPGLLYDLTATENLEFFYSLHHQKSRARSNQNKIIPLLEKSMMMDYKDQTVRSFSRGMKQRIGLCRSLLHEPDLLLYDEPLTGLDHTGQAFCISMLKRHKQNGGSAIIVTHSETPFINLVDRFLFIKQGRLIADVPAKKYNDSSRKHIQSLLYD